MPTGKVSPQPVTTRRAPTRPAPPPPKSPARASGKGAAKKATGKKATGGSSVARKSGAASLKRLSGRSIAPKGPPSGGKRPSAGLKSAQKAVGKVRSTAAQFAKGQQASPKPLSKSVKAGSITPAPPKPLSPKPGAAKPLVAQGSAPASRKPLDNQSASLQAGHKPLGTKPPLPPKPKNLVVPGKAPPLPPRPTKKPVAVIGGAEVMVGKKALKPGDWSSRSVVGEIHASIGASPETDPGTKVALAAAGINAGVKLEGQLSVVRGVNMVRRDDGMFHVTVENTFSAAGGGEARVGAGAAQYGVGTKAGGGYHHKAEMLVHPDDVAQFDTVGKTGKKLTEGSSGKPGTYQVLSSKGNPISFIETSTAQMRFQGKDTNASGKSSFNTQIHTVRAEKELGSVTSISARVETRPAIPLVTYKASISDVALQGGPKGLETGSYTVEVDPKKLTRDLDKEATKLAARFDTACTLVNGAHKNISGGMAPVVDTAGSKPAIKAALEQMKAKMESGAITTEQRRYEGGLNLGYVQMSVTKGDMAMLRFPMERADVSKPFTMGKPQLAVSGQSSFTVGVDVDVGSSGFGGSVQAGVSTVQRMS